jgi:pimeloyl-ACP methyl ester carboxylesterase
LDLETADGRTLHAYDTATDPATRDLPVFWHHGTPNIGAPPEPLFPTAARLGLRWVSYDRPGYGGSTPNPDRTIGSAAYDTATVAAALGVDRFAVVGHSGGGPHALACAALLPQEVLAVVSMAGLAPFTAEGLDWYTGMIPSGEASLRAAAQGRAEKERYETSGVDYDPEFTPADLAALGHDWSWLGSVVGPAVAAGPGGLVDDDLAYVSPWGFDPSTIAVPVLIVHGGHDGIVPCSHGQWLAAHCPSAELRVFPEDGHISVLTHAPEALEWLASKARD